MLMCDLVEKSSSWLTDDVTDLLTVDQPVKVRSSVKKASCIMAWVTTSMLNGATKWHGPGHAEYDEAAALLGDALVTRN